MHAWLGYVRLTFRVVGALLWALTALSLFELRALFAPQNQRQSLLDAYVQRWARGCLWIFGIEHVIRYTAPTSHGARLIVANHRSPLDIVLLLYMFGGSLLSHAGVSHWPIMGFVTRRVGTIFVNRASKQSGVRAIQRIRHRLALGHTIGMFPEGTTFEGDTVHHFRKGFLRASAGLDVEIVPVGVCYAQGDGFVQSTLTQHVLKVAVKPRIHVAVVCGAPLASSSLGLSDASKVHATVQQLVFEARELFNSHWERNATTPAHHSHLKTG